MANKKISILDTAVLLLGTELIPIVQPVDDPKDNKKITINQLMELAPVQVGDNISIFTNDIGYSSLPVIDSTGIVKNAADPTKVVKFSASLLTAGTTRTFAMPDVDGNLMTGVGVRTITVGDTAPPAPILGDVWVDTIAPLTLASYGITDAWRTTGTTTVSAPTIVGRPLFDPDATNAALRIGSVSSDPSSVSNGDVWYNSVSGSLKYRMNSASYFPVMTSVLSTNRVPFGAGNVPYRLQDSANFTYSGNVLTLGPAGGSPTPGIQMNAGGLSFSGVAPSASTINFGSAGTIVATSGNAVLSYTAGVPTNTSGSLSSHVFNVGSGFNFSSGTLTYNFMSLVPTINTTGTYAGTFRGILYAPTVSNAVGLTHYAFQSTAGNILLGNHGLDTGTKLDVRGPSGGNVLRLADNTDTQLFNLSSAGAITSALSTVSLVATGSFGLVTDQGATMSLTAGGINISANGSPGISITASNVNSHVTIGGNASTGSAAQALRISRTYQPSSGTVDFNFLHLTPTWNTTGTFVGNVRGIYYNPTITNLIGATHYAAHFVTGDVLVGSGILRTNHLRSTGVGGSIDVRGGRDATNGVTFASDFVYDTAGTTRTNVSVQPTFSWTSGTNDGTALKVAPVLNLTGGTTTIKGIYYNPTLTATTGLTHNAIETTSGNIIFGGSGGSMTWDPVNKRLKAGSGTLTSGTDNVNFGRITTLTGSWALTVAEESTVRGNNSLSSGWFHEVGDGVNTSGGTFTFGTDNKNYGLGSYVGGVGGKVSYVSTTQRGGFVHAFQQGSADGKKPATVEYLLANDGAGNISRNTSAQTVGHGSLAQDGFIIGGIDHNIPTDSQRSVVIGGNAIKARATDPDNVYVPYFNITQIAQDDALTQVLVRNSTTGKVYWRVDSTFGGGGGITNSAGTNELMKSDGTNAVSSGIWSTTPANLTFGIGTTGTVRTLLAEGSGTDVDMLIKSKGTSTGRVALDANDVDAYLAAVPNANFGGVIIGGANISTPDATLHVGRTGTSSTVHEVIRIRGTSTNVTINPGIGASIGFESETADGVYKLGGLIEAVTTTVTASSEAFDFVFRNMVGGAAATEVLKISSSGDLTIGAGKAAGGIRNITASGIASGQGAHLKLISQSASGGASANGGDVQIALGDGISGGIPGHFSVNTSIGSGYTVNIQQKTGHNAGIMDLMNSSGTSVHGFGATRYVIAGTNDLTNIYPYKLALGGEVGKLNASTAATFDITTANGGSTNVHGQNLAVSAGSGYASSGDGNGGAITLLSGAKRSAGTGVDGAVTLDSRGANINLNGQYVFFGQGTGGTNGGPNIVINKRTSGFLISASADTIAMFAKDSSDANTTLALELEQAVEAIGTFTGSHKIKVFINGSEYWLQLDQVV